MWLRTILSILIIQSPPPKNYDQRHVPSCLVYVLLGIDPSGWYMQGKPSANRTTSSDRCLNFLKFNKINYKNKIRHYNCKHSEKYPIGNLYYSSFV